MFNLDVNGIGEEIINIAKKNGMAAQVTIYEDISRDINVRKGEIEQMFSSTAISTGIRLFLGKKSTIIAFSGKEFDNLEERIGIARKDIAYLEDDPYKRILSPEEIAGDPGRLELDDKGFYKVETDEIVEVLKKIEAGGLAVDDKIKPAEMAEFSASCSRISLFSSEGLAKSYGRSFYSFYYSALAEENGLKEVESWSQRKRFFQDFSNLDEIGSIAAEKALKKLGGRKIKSGEMKVVFSYRTASSILDLLLEALDGEQVLLRNSFLVDKLGEKIVADHLNLVDDPLLDRHPASYPFDGEGMNGKKKTVVENGKLTTYLHNSYSAAKLDMALTGNATVAISTTPSIKSGNFYLEAGHGTLDDLLVEMKEGLLIEEVFLSGMNEVTGDFSFGCSGFMVENGIATYPVKEITVAGNLLELFNRVEAIADDNLWKYSVTAPSFMVSKLSVAGT